MSSETTGLDKPGRSTVETEAFYESFAVVVLTLNEARNIAHCLASVANVKTRLVVDSGSTDETESIARSFGAHFLTHTPSGPFLISEQRNWALNHLQDVVEWVLFLDADEIATPELLQEVAVTLGSSTELDGYWLAPKFIYQGTWLRRYKGYPNWHPRLIRTSRRLTGGVWENFSPGARTGHIRSAYLHYPNSKGFDDWISRHLRYAVTDARLASTDLAQYEKRHQLRRILRVLGPSRAYLAPLYDLVLRRGFLDGGAVWSYFRRSLIYELMLVEARRQQERDVLNLPR